MATFRVTMNSTQLRAERVRSNKGRHANIGQLIRFFRGLLIGASYGTVAVEADASKVAAAGTVTCASVQAADTVIVGNVTLTADAVTNTGLNFALGASDTACGDNLAAAINRHAVLSLYVLAVAVTGVVTITAIAKALGVIGNLVKLTSSNNTRLAVVVFASGAEDSTAVSHTF